MRTELLLPQNQTVCIREKEVQVCCNRWLKREMAFVLLQDGSLFLSDLRKLDLDTAGAIDMSIADALSLGP